MQTDFTAEKEMKETVEKLQKEAKTMSLAKIVDELDLKNNRMNNLSL